MVSSPQVIPGTPGIPGADRQCNCMVFSPVAVGEADGTCFDPLCMPSHLSIRHIRDPVPVPEREEASLLRGGEVHTGGIFCDMVFICNRDQRIFCAIKEMQTTGNPGGENPPLILSTAASVVLTYFPDEMFLWFLVPFCGNIIRIPEKGVKQDATVPVIPKRGHYENDSARVQSPRMNKNCS